MTTFEDAQRDARERRALGLPPLPPRRPPILPAPRRKSLNKEAEEWFHVTARDPCPWCGRRMTRTRPGYDPVLTDATRDHLTAHSRGGSRDWDNITAACHACNVAKGDRSVLEFLALTTLPRNAATRIFDAATRAFGPVLHRRDPSGRKARRALLWLARTRGVLDEVIGKLPPPHRNRSAMRSQAYSDPPWRWVTRLQSALGDLEGA